MVEKKNKLWNISTLDMTFERDIGKHENTMKNNMVGYIFTRTQNGTYAMRQKDLLMMIPHQMLLTMIRRVLLN